MNENGKTDARRSGRKGAVIGLICVVFAAALAVLLLFLTGVIGERKTGGGSEMIVGKGVAAEKITEFYYTYASSTNPPDYQRYRFYVEDGKRLFYHETRAGDHWPLTERDVTISGTRELSDAEWAAFYACIDGGTVKKRQESLDSGDSGPWLYLYWDGDRGENQQFAFASWGAQKEFEALCETLRVQ